MDQRVPGGPGWNGWAEAPLREVRAHPWLGMAAGIAAGALLGALTRREVEEPPALRIRIERGGRIGLQLPPRPRPETEPEEDEAPGRLEQAGARVGEVARGAGESLRGAWEEAREAVSDTPERLREGAEWLAERVPRRRPPSRMARLRHAVSDALPWREEPTLGERVRRAFE